ncbi:MAG: HAD-IA family hydrolase [Myxococcales bacterium]|nr:HAD-IA family hydrolase [Myxococcales bacterium]
MSSVILWDLMDTLVHDPFYREVPAFFGMSLDELIAVKHPRLWGQFELGRVDETTLLRDFFRDGRSFDGPGLKRCMVESCGWIAGIEALLAELKAAGVAMHLLSNYSPWYADYVERLGIGRYIEPSFVSCNTGVRKPDARAFLGPCQQLGVAPERCLLIDDREQNTAAAASLGLDTIRFQGEAAALRDELTRRGLLP